MWLPNKDGTVEMKKVTPHPLSHMIIDIVATRPKEDSEPDDDGDNIA